MQSKSRQDIHTAGVPVLCQACEARHRGICGALSDNQLVALSKSTSKLDFAPAEPIVAGGAKVERFGNILRGVVKLAKLTADGRQQIVGLQFAPDFLGRVFKETSDFDIEAATDVKVCSFPRQTLEKLIQENPELEHRLHEQTLKELDEAREWMLMLGRKTAAERVASFLHYVSSHMDPERADADEPARLHLPLKRADMADFLGLTIETVSRQLSKLRQSGIIDLPDTKTVVILDAAALQAMTEQAA